jgi:histidyl-tRNA synthetase
MTQPNFRAVKGMQDLLGDSLAATVRVEATAARLFTRYGYREVRPPLLEERALYVHSSGETSEIVEKQMFVVHREDADYALRPEGTPSVVRLYLEQNLHKQAPFQKFWYSGPMFRYERPQRARLRQFHQVGVELLGSGDPLHDAEVIALGAKFFVEIGLQGVSIKLNSLGDATCRPAYRQELLAFQTAHAAELCDACRGRMDKNPLRFLDCKAPGCRALRAEAPRLERCAACDAHFAEVRALLDGAGIAYVVDPMLVRGLDYYTRTLFEYTYAGLGARDAVGGGGRYDGMVEEFGGPATQAIGFAMGVEATLIALEAAGRAAEKAAPALDLFVVLAGGSTRAHVFLVVQACRDAGAATDFGEFGKSVKSQMRAADAAGARHVVVLGGEEFTTGRCRLRVMATREEREVAVVDLGREVASQAAGAGR